VIVDYWLLLTLWYDRAEAELRYPLLLATWTYSDRSSDHGTDALMQEVLVVLKLQSFIIENSISNLSDELLLTTGVLLW